MKLTCTACGATGSVEQFTADADARTALALVLKLPHGVGGVALRYIGLFRPAKRGLTWDRACKLLGELAAMIEAGHVHKRGKALPATPALFAAAMQQMLDQRERLDLPLTTHGYLIAIVAGDSPRESAQLEAQTEATKRAQSTKRAEPAESLFDRMQRRRLEEEAAGGKTLPLLSGAIKRVD